MLLIELGTQDGLYLNGLLVQLGLPKEYIHQEGYIKRMKIPFLYAEVKKHQRQRSIKNIFLASIKKHKLIYFYFPSISNCEDD